MTESQQKPELDAEWVQKIYGFCRSRLHSEQDAEDLSQDICLEIIKTIRAGKTVGNWNAFVWSVSEHLFWNWLRKKKRGSTAYLTDVFPSEEDLEEEYILKEQTMLLRRELSLLSESYRQAVILRYFDRRSCEEIGELLGKSAGTVKWWLHDARKMIQEGMNTVREYGEKSYRPGSLTLACQGNPGVGEEPMSCAKRKSAQNILLAAYKNPMTVEALCTELGIAAPYMEDELRFLVENQLMKEVSKGRFQTDFVILPGQDAQQGTWIYQSAFPEFYEILTDCLESHREKLSGASFNRADFSWGRLLWVYLHVISELAIDQFKAEYRITVPYRDMPARPNGGKWIAFGFENGAPAGEKLWEDYHPYDGPVHKTAHGLIQGFFHIWSGLDSSAFFELPDEVFRLCGQIVRGEKRAEELEGEEKYLFSIALEKKLFIREKNRFRLNYYYVNRSEYEELRRIAAEFYTRAKPVIRRVYDGILERYASTVPMHLRNQMGNFLTNSLSLLVTCSLYEAKRAGALSEPDENNFYWLSLFAWE